VYYLVVCGGASHPHPVYEMLTDWEGPRPHHLLAYPDLSPERVRDASRWEMSGGGALTTEGTVFGIGEE
jgi:hypothetical protein